MAMNRGRQTGRVGVELLQPSYDVEFASLTHPGVERVVGVDWRGKGNGN